MTDARYEDTSASALRLRLYDGFVDRSDFAVFASGRALCSGIEVDAAVIGSSHWMEVRMDGGVALTEVLACQPASAGRTLAVWRPGEAAIESAVRDVARYRFEAQVVSRDLADAELSRLRRLIGFASLVATEVGLAFEFPTAAGGSGTAETLVWAAATAAGVTARTAHSYASEGLVVLSSTEIQLAAANRQRAGYELVASV